MHPQLPHPVDAAVVNLRTALFVYLHELRWDDDANEPHKVAIRAELTPSGALEGEFHVTNIKTGEAFAFSL